MPLSEGIETNPFEEDPRPKSNENSPFNLSKVPATPSRRGIIKNTTNDETTAGSPTKTPNGRAGLSSPMRRASQEASQSARKSASKSYSRLMEEEMLDDEDDAMKQQELQLAEQIIMESKNAMELSESDLANDAPVVASPKRKRGRPRKEEAALRKALVEPELPMSPRRLERRAFLQQKAALRQESEKDDDPYSKIHKDEGDDFELSDDEEKVVKKARKPRAKTQASPKKSPSKTPSVQLTPERRTKKGRPSKQENVTKQVHSIFQMDDLAFFQDNIKVGNETSRVNHGSNGSNKPGSATASPQKVTNYLNFENTGDSTFSSVPIISGIVEKKPDEEDLDMDKITKFVPMPVPDVDEEGNVTDQAYLQKYFKGANFDAETKGRLTDERAFFLEGSEGYFEQHNLRFRPSSSSLASKAPTLEYEEFIPMVNLGTLLQGQERHALRELHKELYHQWCLELSQGYSLNLYGVGSKSSFILDFVNGYLLDWYEQVLQEEDEYPVVMVVNGYNPSTKLKTVIHDIIAAIITPEIQKQQNLRTPKHVAEAFPYLLRHLAKQQTVVRANNLVKPALILAVHNIDGQAFRDERSQHYLSQLASLANVWFITSSDHINSSLLWDLNRFKNFNFLWHNLTTYEPYSVEMSFKDVLTMGQSKKFLGSKGVRYVLTSLNSNARNLYRVLLQAQLKVLEEISTEASRTGLKGNLKAAVDFRKLYEQCQQAFVTSNEMNFRSILGEYVEHKMCVLAKNAQGAEVVYVAFSYGEMEKLLAEAFQ